LEHKAPPLVISPYYGGRAAEAAYAQNRILLQGDIPLDFTVAGKTLPAETYSVPNIPAYSGRLIIRGTENLESAHFMTFAKQKPQACNGVGMKQYQGFIPHPAHRLSYL